MRFYTHVQDKGFYFVPRSFSPMGLLDRFEQSMERLLEGATGSIFRQKIQPAEIGKKLERAMLANQRASVGSRLVPNAYVVRLHPKDYAQVSDFSAGLSRQLESWLSQVATQQKFTVLDRISVVLKEDESARQRNPIIDATIIDNVRSRVQAPGHAASRPPVASPPADATAAYEVAPRHNEREGAFTLRATSGRFTGRSFALTMGDSTIGRSPDNTIVLDSPDVSRRHARIERSGNHFRIYDLNSTNGTRVNGEAVHISDIQPGDDVRIGGQTLTLIADGHEPRPDHRERW